MQARKQRSLEEISQIAFNAKTTIKMIIYLNEEIAFIASKWMAGVPETLTSVALGYL